MGHGEWAAETCSGVMTFAAAARALDDVLIEAPQDGLAVEEGRGLMGGQSY